MKLLAGTVPENCQKITKYVQKQLLYPKKITNNRNSTEMYLEWKREERALVSISRH